MKTTDAYTIRTTPLVGYVDALISAQRVPDWDHALGLYVVGRADAALQGLENAIVAEKRMRQLRVATTESVLSLAELVHEGLLSTAEAVSILRPAGVFVDDTVDLLTRMTATKTTLEAVGPSSDGAMATTRAGQPSVPSPDSESTDVAASQDTLYLLTPVADEKEATARDTIKGLLDSGWYVFGERTAGRRSLKPGDRVAFYESGVGVVADAEVVSIAERRSVPGVRHPERFPWAFRVGKPRYFFDTPVVIDPALRARLDAFAGRDPVGPWAWFVQGTRVISAHDFAILTGVGD